MDPVHTVYTLHSAITYQETYTCLPSESPYRQMLFEVHSDQCLLLEGMKKMQNKSGSQLQNKLGSQLQN